ncbi:hypothetical protein GCM10010468_04970 [Actinocorallia longicatena]|uniref:Uncharacterized protein n=1 Tax=Actinocorallia longicatena TaxID=111803 RepID=A0ABP6Q003_9ACTN
MDAKKKELVGQFKNPGRQWRPAGEPATVRAHGFPDPGLGKAIPTESTIAEDNGWVGVGTDHDTAEYAVGHSVAGGKPRAACPTQVPGVC